MTVLDQHTATARILPAGITLKVSELELTLDEAWSPYAQARLVCVLPPDAQRELIDLRGRMTVTINMRQDFSSPWPLSRLTDDFGGSVAAMTDEFGGKPLSAVYQRYSRPWNAFGRRDSTTRRVTLVVTSREFDHQDGTLTLTAASGEARLQQDALVDTAPLDPGTTSVRTIAQLLLDRIGAQLQPGTQDATVDAEATVWRPGVTAWDYFQPLMEAGDLRLWCDDAGKWWLTEPQPVVAGTVVLSDAQPVTELVDVMRVGGEEWFDAVVVEYKWVDALDLNRIEYDVAGAARPRSILRLERTTPHPGPGAAAGILARASGRGRTLTVDAVSDYNTEPGKAARIIPPGADLQTGYVASVRYQIPEAVMQITSRGLVDTPALSWLAAPEGLTWNDIPVGMSWLDYDPELIGA